MANDSKVIGDIVKKCKILLLDIEGTTTSISFVKDKLFPYAEENVKQFLNSQWETDEVKEAVAALRKLALEDKEKSVDGVVVIPGEDASKEDQIDGLVNNVKWQMSSDRKEGALKQLQGLIWKQGYDSGDIKGHVYDDVSAALEQWHSVEGQKVYIYSSGSVQAQKLLFGQSLAGDLLRFIDGHFDTAVGAKQDSTSYTAIAEKIGVQPAEVLFLTDIPKEGEAARLAGFHVALVSREGNASLPQEATEAYAVLHSLGQLTASNKRKTDPQDELPAKVPKTDTDDDVKTAAESFVSNVKVPEKEVKVEEEKMEVEESVQYIAEKANVEKTVATTETIINDVTNTDEALDVPMVDIEPVVTEVNGEKSNTGKKTEEDMEATESVEVVTTPGEDTTKSKEAITKPDDVVINPDDILTKSEDVVTKPEEVLSKPEEVISKSEEVVTDSEEVETKSEVVTKPEQVVTKLVEVITKAEEIAIKPKEIVTKSAEVVTKPVDVVTKPEEVVTKSEEVVKKSEEIVTKSEVVTKADEVVPKPEEVVTKPEEVETKPEEVVTKPEEVVTKPEEVVTKPEEVVTKPEEVVTKPEEVVTKPEEVVIRTTKVLESTELSLPNEGNKDIKETVTKPAENIDSKINDKKQKEEPVDSKEQIETEVVKENAKIGEGTLPIVVTEIEEITAENLGDVAEMMEGLEPIVEEPPNEDMEDLQNVGEVLEKECDEILSKVQDVTNLDSIPLKPLLNTIAEETMETEMDAENMDSNDIVDRILDSELELEMKECNDIDPNTVSEITDDEKMEESVDTKLTGDNNIEPETNTKLDENDKELSSALQNMDTESSQVESKAEDDKKNTVKIESNEKQENEKEVNKTTKVESNDKVGNTDEIESNVKVVCNEKVENKEKVDVEDKVKDKEHKTEKIDTSDKVESKDISETTDKVESTDIMKSKNVVEETKTEEKKALPSENNKNDVSTQVESKDSELVSKETANDSDKDKESQVNGKPTNGDAETVNLNGDASNAEELNSRLSVENGKEPVNGSNGDSVDSEKGQGDKMEAEVSDIKVKTVATDEPRTDPIEQPMEA